MSMASSDPYETPKSDVISGNGDERGTVKVLSISGRIGRIRYLAYNTAMMLLVLFGTSVPTAIMLPNIANQDSSVWGVVLAVVMMAIYLFMVVATFVLAVRRINDFDYSGWLSLLLLVPFVNFLFMLALGFIPGTKGENRYGMHPMDNSGGAIFLAVLMPVFVVLFGVLAAISIPAYNDYAERARMEQGQK